MKVGIITILKVNNYGAELQAFALQRMLSKLGCFSEIIDYLYYKHRDYEYTPSARPFVKVGLLRRIKGCVLPFLEQAKSIRCPDIKKRRDARFIEFHRSNTKLSSTTYKSIDHLYKADFDYDVYIVGSDQVWNPNTNVSLKPYFLTFAPKNKKKFSYASSFGVSAISREYYDIYKKCLNNLDEIAVREKQGVAIVQDITDRKASHVLDPTLLLTQEDWSEVASIPIESTKPYLLLYDLIRSPFTSEIAKNIAESLNMEIIRICKDSKRKNSNSKIRVIGDAGPSEFVGLFLEASFVITNSFHGTTFAVNFSKPFFTILPKNKSNNSRQEDFLHSIGLEKRLVREGGPLPSQENFSLDYSLTSKLLEIEREKSINYLTKCLTL